MVNVKGERSLYVHLHNKLAGQLFYDGNIYRFRYDSSYLKKKTKIPISLSLPLEDSDHIGSMGGKNLPYYFHSIMPEGWLLNLARNLKMQVNQPMDVLQLLCLDTIGAIKITKEVNQINTESLHMDHNNDPLIISSDVDEKSSNIVKHQHCLFCGEILVRKGANDNYHPECAKILFGGQITPKFKIDRSKIRDLASKQLKSGMSLTGVQEKFSLKHRVDRKTIATPFSFFIVKPQPQTKELEELSMLEGAYMLYARRIGIPVAHSGVIYLEDGTSCFITRRFDVKPSGERIHQEDLAAPLERYDKYESSHEAIAKLLVNNKTISNKRSQNDRLNFLKITVMNFILGNSDGHLKNFAIFHEIENEKYLYRLTPFYDIFPSLLYAPTDTDELGISLSNRKNRFFKREFEQLARLLNLGPRTLSGIVARIRSSRELLISCLEAYHISNERKYKILELARERLRRFE